MQKFPVKPAEEYDFKGILYEKKDWIATITINRPKVYNAYNTATLFEMVEALKDAEYDDSIGVVVLTGAGDKAFCTGGDVVEYATEFTAKPRDYWHYIMRAFGGAVELLKGIPKPTIARINGLVAGGGNELNMACDLAVCADHATIRQVGVRVGSVAAGGATQWLPIMIGDRRAREMLYTCDPISAQQALDWGLVNRVVPYAELDGAVNELSEKILNKFPECLRYTKTQTNYWKDMVWTATVPHAADWFALHFMSAEVNEGMKSFVEKRPTDYMKLRQLAAEGKSSEYVWGPYSQACSACGAKDIPAEFAYCGACGAKLAK